ncbi:MAG: hypothetical protein EZS28_014238 [Streblomastix strix]|uniref:OTU domain-containing protein n=1 Tax=Streblomastix strix TaxID=222440 RepID=A0A5J4W6F8_9EUKA|nr:MAG: hypothetical protein EZS28_014238 [Streblomastix strix]
MDLAGELTIFDDEIDQDTSNDRNVDIKKQKRCRVILDLQDENEIIVQQPIQRKRLRRSSTTNSSQTSSSEQIFTHINDSELSANQFTSTAPINSHNTSSGQLLTHINDSELSANSFTSAAQINSHNTSSGQLLTHINDSGLSANQFTSTAPINSHTSSSGQKIPDKSAESISIQQNYKQKKFQLIDNSANGDCFFKAVSVCLCNVEKYHKQLQRQVCVYIQSHPVEFERFFISQDRRDQLDEMQRLGIQMTAEEMKYNREMITLNQYIPRMSIVGTWAEGAVLDATALSINRQIVTHIQIQPTIAINQTAIEQIHLLFVNNNHYISMIELL